MAADPCRCGHPRDVHQHHAVWRSDCGLCGKALCPAYRRPPPDWTLAAALRLNRVFAIIRGRS